MAPDFAAFVATLTVPDGQALDLEPWQRTALDGALALAEGRLEDATREATRRGRTRAQARVVAHTLLLEPDARIAVVCTSEAAATSYLDTVALEVERVGRLLRLDVADVADLTRSTAIRSQATERESR